MIWDSIASGGGRSPDVETLAGEVCGQGELPIPKITPNTDSLITMVYIKSTHLMRQTAGYCCESRETLLGCHATEGKS